MQRAPPPLLERSRPTEFPAELHIYAGVGHDLSAEMIAQGLTFLGEATGMGDVVAPEAKGLFGLISVTQRPAALRMAPRPTRSPFTRPRV